MFDLLSVDRIVVLLTFFWINFIYIGLFYHIIFFCQYNII